MLTEATSSPAKVILGCSKCGAVLPDQAQFCLKCGKPVAIPLKETIVQGPGPTLVEPRRKPRIFLWILLGLLLGLIAWVAISDDPFAQGFQEMVGWKHDQTILDTPFTVSAHNFRYYKFTLPEGSVHVSIVGQFTSTSADTKAVGAGRQRPCRVHPRADRACLPARMERPPVSPPPARAR